RTSSAFFRQRPRPRGRRPPPRRRVREWGLLLGLDRASIRAVVAPASTRTTMHTPAIFAMQRLLPSMPTPDQDQFFLAKERSLKIWIGYEARESLPPGGRSAAPCSPRCSALRAMPPSPGL